ncbi:MAG: TatD family hydrolase [Armatimonadetes bacterium]|nr:TatD family hydrolase [Armatimonadota bacterium]
MTWLLAGCMVAAAEPVVWTVTGPVPAARLGRVLVHEHVLVDFGGADVATPERYDADEVYRIALPHLEAVKRAGIDTLVECTPKHLGRDPVLLRRLSEASGVRLVTNTGLYQGKYLPEWARTATVEQLAADWTKEAREGLDGTGIRPGFIKIAVDGPPISELQQRIVRAAARTALANGLPITMHCPSGRSALQAVDLVEAEGLPASRLIVAHSDAEPDPELHYAVAARGAWLSYDGIRAEAAEAKAKLVAAAYARHPERLLISQDAGWYHVGEPGGGQFVPLDWLPREFTGKLAAAGLPAEAVERLLVTNPAAALQTTEGK